MLLKFTGDVWCVVASRYFSRFRRSPTTVNLGKTFGRSVLHTYKAVVLARSSRGFGRSYRQTVRYRYRNVARVATEPGTYQCSKLKFAVDGTDSGHRTISNTSRRSPF